VTWMSEREPWSVH